MAAILQTIFPDAFPWRKIFAFGLRFHCNLFLRVQLTISQHWFREWLGAEKATSHYLDPCWRNPLTRICGTRGDGLVQNVHCHRKETICHTLTLPAFQPRRHGDSVSTILNTCSQNDRAIQNQSKSLKWILHPYKRQAFIQINAPVGIGPKCWIWLYT